MNQIGIDQICDIGEVITVNPRLLTCSICFCININAKECMNKKCQKLFCEECAKTNKIKGVKSSSYKNICPFCRLEIDFTKADDILLDVISNLKFFCNEFSCNTKFILLEYLSHLTKPKLKNYFCLKCKNDKLKSPLIKCEVCLNYFCGVSPSSGCGAIKRCFNCKMSICENCSKYTNSSLKGEILCGVCSITCEKCKGEAKIVCSICNKLLCKECSIFCEECEMFICQYNLCYKAKAKECLDCQNIPLNYFYNKCSHSIYLECNKCYSKCNKCGKATTESCNRCLKKTCIKNCTTKCKSCKEGFCNSCIEFCNICKKSACVECLSSCDNCSSSLKSCLDCNSDTIRKCSKINCNKKLCLNCWNVCNYCNVIYCNEHSINCINCEDRCCYKHYHNCNLCNKSKDDEKFKRLCCKCTFKCYFCENVTNSLCLSGKHNDNLVKKLNCGHNVCKTCLKGCGLCGNVVLSCPKCIVNYYFHFCKNCNIYLCATCAKFCSQCEDVYCSLDHKCVNCNKLNLSCLNCSNMKRLQCRSCNNKFELCDKCNKKYICSLKCYLEFKEKYQKCGCEMFLCNKDLVFKDSFLEKDEDIVLVFTRRKENNNNNNSPIKSLNPNRNNRSNLDKNEKVKIGCIHGSCCILY